MNETKITKFLVEQIGWEYIRTDEFGNITIQDKTGFKLSFNPFGNIAHAWMIIDWMILEEYTMSISTISKIFITKIQKAPSVGKRFEAREFAAPKAICIAAAKALATEEELKEMEL